VDAFICYKQKCKVVSLNLAHSVYSERFAECVVTALPST